MAGVAHTSAILPHGVKVIREFVTFNIMGQMFGIPVLKVQDILTPDHIANIPLAPPEVMGSINLRGRIVTVIDVRTQAAADPDYRLSVGDIQAWEKRHGRIPRGAVVVMYSGWGRFWPENDQVSTAATTTTAQFVVWSRRARHVVARSISPR